MLWWHILVFRSSSVQAPEVLPTRCFQYACVVPAEQVCTPCLLAVEDVALAINVCVIALPCFKLLSACWYRQAEHGQLGWLASAGGTRQPGLARVPC